jgi:hypothetical protein
MWIHILIRCSWKVKEGWLVHHYECRCTEEWCTCNNGERGRWRRVELRWRDALGREEVKIKTWLSGGESNQIWDDLFIAVEGESQTVRGGWSMMVVWIQYFGFGLRGETTGWSIARRWSRGKSLSWLHEKEARHNAAMWRRQLKERRH